MSVTLFKNNLFVITSVSVFMSPPASLKVAVRSSVLIGLLPSANVKYAPTNPYAVVELSLTTLLVSSKMFILTLFPFTTASPYLLSNDALTVVLETDDISTGRAMSKSNVASLILVLASANMLPIALLPTTSTLLNEPVEKAFGTALASYGCVSNSP